MQHTNRQSVFHGPKPPWSHLWINHMYFFARKWRILSKFSCFALEGSHRRLKPDVAQ